MTTPRGPQPSPGQEKRLRLLAFVRQDSVVRVDKRVEDTAMTWPHLLVIEFIAAMIWSLGLFVISAAFNAPLQDHSTVHCTPNPSKAPWYLLNLQELLLHMDKGRADVVARVHGGDPVHRSLARRHRPLVHQRDRPEVRVLLDRLHDGARGRAHRSRLRHQ